MFRNILRVITGGLTLFLSVAAFTVAPEAIGAAVIFGVMFLALFVNKAI